ncbi:MAG: RluA family pseudouridine synthase [Candidatus Omnitrophica bacterium]|nr:RluA family pseudouridine synthase [Candidatus Omnitrophota bacterium]
MKKTIIVPEAFTGMRLDKFLDEQIQSLSRAKITNLIKQKLVLVNANPSKPSFQLKGRQEVSIVIHKQKDELKPYDFKVNIVYEDDLLIVVDKPYGLTVHPPHFGVNDTLVNALIYLKKKLSAISPLRPGIVHRLDKETSGLMVIAKTDSCHAALSAQFKDRKVDKVYRGICWGQFKEDFLTVDLPIARDAKNRLKMRVSFKDSKCAHTDVSVMRRFNDATLLGIKLHTGRMHQIRVHLKFLGYPIVGDTKYGKKKDKYKKLLLHSFMLKFIHPGSGRQLAFTSNLPDRFESFIKERDV